MPHPGMQHPPEWRADLNPSAGAGTNFGNEGPHPEDNARTAYDYKDVHRSLSGFTDDELKTVPIMPRGSRLEQGATYFDLADPERGEFTGVGDMSVTPEQRLILKSAMDYDLWNRLTGTGVSNRA